jgi:hypothetical protein
MEERDGGRLDRADGFSCRWRVSADVVLGGLRPPNLLMSSEPDGVCRRRREEGETGDSTRSGRFEELAR